MSDALLWLDAFGPGSAPGGLVVGVDVFEDFVVDTYNYIEQLASFLQTKTTKTTKAAIHKQGCPRTQKTDKRQMKLEIINKEATAPYLELMDEMIEDYKTDWV